MNDIDKLIDTVPGLTLDEQFELINQELFLWDSEIASGMRLHTKRPGSMPFTF